MGNMKARIHLQSLGLTHYTICQVEDEQKIYQNSDRYYGYLENISMNERVVS